MPVIVDEIVISVDVSNEASAGVASKPSATPLSTEDKQVIINECVERVLDILERKADR